MSTTGMGAALAALLAAPAAAQHVFVLTDTAANLYVDEFRVSAAELGLEDGWVVRRETLRGGKQEGVDTIVIETRDLTAVVVPTRGMSVQEVRCAGARLGWDSPSAEIVHPALVDLGSRGGLGWLEGFNEQMVRCGLEFAGHPGEDELVDNTGETVRMDLTLHGRVGNLPAARVELVVDERPPHRIRLVGTVFERTFYGPKLRLDAELSVVPGERAWRVSDTVTNVGAAPQEFQLIYHGNYGPPLLGEGARLVVPARSIAPMNANAALGIETWATYRGPAAGFVEEVFLIEPWADDDGATAALLVAPDGSFATSVRWRVAELPCFTQWKNTAALADGYVTGMEPGTSFPFNRSVERRHGRVPRLDAGESRSFTLDYALHVGQEAVQAAEAEVRVIQAGRPTDRRGVPD